MPDSWQLLTGELRVGRRFVPAHARHRVIRLPTWVVARFPRGRAGTPRLVLEQGNPVFPGKHPTVLHERLLPEVPTPVAAAVHEAFELTVGDFVPVDEVGSQFDRLQLVQPYQVHVDLAAWYPHHAGRENAPVIEDESVGERAPRRGGFEGLVSWLLQLQSRKLTGPPVPTPRKPHTAERRGTQILPRRIRRSIRSAVHPRSGWRGADLDRAGHSSQEGHEKRVPRDEAIGLQSELVSRLPATRVHQLADLRDRLLSRPVDPCVSLHRGEEPGSSYYKDQDGCSEHEQGMSAEDRREYRPRADRRHATARRGERL